DRDAVERKRACQRPGIGENLHRSHPARPRRPAGGHRRSRDFPRLRPVLLCHRLDPDGGWRVQDELRKTSVLIQSEPKSSERRKRAMSNAPHYNIDVATFWADPYPDLARMRREAPIAFVPQLGSTIFPRRDDIFTQEKRIDVFSSHQPNGLMNLLMGHNMMRKDGAAHMSERAQMFPSVSPKAVRETWMKKFQAHADRI